MTLSSPSTVPSRVLVSGNIWNDLGDRPHDTLLKIAEDRPLFFLENHHIPGHLPRGGWVAASAEVARQVLLDTDTFSSAKVTSISALLGGNLDVVPIEVDPPEHGKYRSVIAEYFKPRAVAQMAENIRKRSNDLIDSFISAGRCDFVEQFGRVLPASIFLDLYGLPQEQSNGFLEIVDIVMGSRNVEDRVAAWRKIRGILEAEVADRRKNPKADLLSAWANAVIDGRPATDAEAIGGVMLLFGAGLDTVAATMGWCFRHLAENLSDQRLLRECPEEISGALEEFFRFFAPANMNRRATRDTELAGEQIRKGDAVTILTTIPCRDPKEFDAPNELDIRKGARRHLAFGYGPHTCVGMHLARLELKISLECWLERIPEFRIASDGPFRSHGGTAISLDELPIEWEAHRVNKAIE